MAQDNAYRQLMSDMQRDTQLSTDQRARDTVANEMFAARDDIRHKLIEEGWTGTQQTGNVALPGYQVDTSTDANPDQGNIWGDTDGTEWGEGGTVWSNENNAGVWGRENEPEVQASEVQAPEIEEPETEQEV